MRWRGWRSSAASARRAGTVAVLDPLALRARRVRALFLCGLQEGVFPARPRPQPLLAEEERRRLARKLRSAAGRAGGCAGGRAVPALRGGVAPGGAARAELARGRRRRRADRRGRCSSTTSSTCSRRASCAARWRPTQADRDSDESGVPLRHVSCRRCPRMVPDGPTLTSRRGGSWRAARARLVGLVAVRCGCGCPVHWFVERMLRAERPRPGPRAIRARRAGARGAEGHAAKASRARPARHG